MLAWLLRVQPEVSQCCLASEALPSEPFTYFGNSTLIFLEGAIPTTQSTRFRLGDNHLATNLSSAAHRLRDQASFSVFIHRVGTTTTSRRRDELKVMVPLAGDWG